jgi:hypothetical protein
MSIRLILIAGLLSLAVGCSTPTSASAGRTVAATSPADPHRWDRQACFRGERPPELDSRAFARARLEDLHASGSAGRSPLATEQLLEKRGQFDARCDRWRRDAPVSASTPVGGRTDI